MLLKIIPTLMPLIIMMFSVLIDDTNELIFTGFIYISSVLFFIDQEKMKRENNKNEKTSNQKKL